MKKVSIVWRILFILAIGYSIGTFVTIKYLVPPSTSISIGRIKLKGDGGTIAPEYHIETSDDTPTRKEERKDKRDIRAADRAIKKAARKRNRDGG